ncbi:MAG: TrkA C-terminal domain-containing protein [Caldilineaceae bacterium]
MQAGDVLLVRTTPEELASTAQKPGVTLHPVAKYGDAVPATKETEEKDAPEQLIQAVIAPDSDMIGRTIGNVNFLERYGVLVVGIWRRKGWLQTELARATARRGCVGVAGDEEAFAASLTTARFSCFCLFKGNRKCATRRCWRVRLWWRPLPRPPLTCCRLKLPCWPARRRRCCSAV